jgi:transposase
MAKRMKTYTAEFRGEAVKMVYEQGFTQEEAAKRLGIPKGTLGGWMAAAKPSAMKPSAPGARTATELEAENTRLRKELAEARMERDVLKKATAYFAKESLPGTRS